MKGRFRGVIWMLAGLPKWANYGGLTGRGVGAMRGCSEDLLSQLSIQVQDEEYPVAKEASLQIHTLDKGSWQPLRYPTTADSSL